MKKSYVLVTFAVVVILAFSSGAALAASGGAAAADMGDAADRLSTLGLFRGVGTNADGSTDFALERAPNRAEAVAMIVRLIGMEKDALQGNWTTPFSDVPAWAEPSVGYAYENGLVFGVDGAAFAGCSPVTAPEYLTLILRALGYTSGKDFEWDKAWVLSDAIGFTDGSYNCGEEEFLRSDVARISLSALGARYKDSGKTVCSVLIENGVFTEEDASAAGVYATQEDATPEEATLHQGIETPTEQAPDWRADVLEIEARVFDLINIEREKQGLETLAWDSRLADVARAHSADMSQKGFFAHINLSGKTPAQRKMDAGIIFRFSGENIARGFRTPESVVRAWMESPSHKKAILSEMASSMGVGFYNYYWTVDFAG